MHNKLIIIGGPTASGKTALGIRAAKQLGTEIISADSRQCYKELNIGVAKPSEAELETATHHFINYCSILTPLNMVDFEKYALEKLEKIYLDQSVAICVGGTGMYMKALVDGVDLMPPVDIEIKKAMEDAYVTNGMEWLSCEIERLDKVFYEIGEMQNPARMLRALIFVMSNGRSITEYWTKKKAPRNFDTSFYCIDIERALLYENINKRVDEMFLNGLVEEVEQLVSYKDLPNLKTVGYSELFDYLDGKISLDRAKELIKQNTRRYAKRQLTWFRNDGRYTFASADEIMDKISAG